MSHKPYIHNAPSLRTRQCIIQITMHADVVVIGAGASGLMCAIQAGRRGRKTIVLEGTGRIGSKIAVSGGGRCNFTNHHVSAEHYLSENRHFCRSALARFSAGDFIGIMKKHGVPFSEKEDGQLFCDRGSRAVINMLHRECDDAGVRVMLSSPVSNVSKDGHFSIEAGRGLFTADALVVATGGLSYRKLGATDIGYRIGDAFGLKRVGTRPGLVPFVFRQWARWGYAGLSGVSLPVSVRCRGKSFSGGMVFTHRGLSGPAVLQASSYWREGDPIAIDLLPDTDAEILLFSNRSRKSELKTLLSQHLPRRFVEILCGRLLPSRPLCQYPERELRRIGGVLKHWELTPSGTEGFDHAEVTVGGINTAGISSQTMEARDVPGLYFTGEVLDVTGQLGGYNLHWAWASGYAAGQHA